MAKIKLDLKEIELEFFTDVWVFAIAAFGMKDYRFCWLLNKAFGLNLVRKHEFDIPYFEKKAKIIIGNLFEIEEEEAHIKPSYFSFYQHEVPMTGTGIYLYNNRFKNNLLIPEWKQADYFLYVPYDSGFLEQDILLSFEQLKEVQWARTMKLNEPGFKSKQNLMF